MTRTLTLAVCAGLVAAVLAGLMVACAQEKDEEGWISLFNGKDKTGWRLKNPNGADGWSVVEGVLINKPPSTDLVCATKMMDHELHVEFRIPPNSNSGVYLQGRYEIQIDDAKKRGDNLDQHMCGAIYGRIAPSKNVAKDPGEWQTYDAKFIAARLDEDGNKVENARVTLVFNGEKVIDDQEIAGVTGAALDNKEGTPGPLYLQGNHGAVEYRNIRWRPLKAE
ncbi:MAG: DUF1080 domain-containing protein [Armatimonadota bacterium]